MNRIDRLTAILIHLQGKRVVTAAELAERFEISHRTVYRDINALMEAGVPICSEPGVGYYLVKGYYLPPLMFTRDEAASILIAGKLFEQYSDSSKGKVFQSALYKIKAVLSDYDKDHLEDLNRKIIVNRRFEPQSLNSRDNLSELQRALGENRVIKIDYYSPYKDSETTRELEPAGLCFYSSQWHLIAYCRLRDAFRDFRVDRITSLKVKDELFQKRAYSSFSELLNNLETDNTLTKVTLKIKGGIYYRVLQEKYYYGFIEEKEPDSKGWREMLFMVSSLNYLASWILTLGIEVEIVNPPELKELVVCEVKKLATHYCS